MLCWEEKREENLFVNLAELVQSYFVVKSLNFLKESKYLSFSLSYPVELLLFLVIPRSPKTRSQNIAAFKPFPS